MRIGIDARLFGLTHRGIGRYLENLIINLEKIDQINQYYIFLQPDNFNDYQPTQKNFKKILVKYRWYTIKEQIFFPFLIKKLKIDLMHFPNFNVPLFCPVKLIFTLHDLTLIHFPNRQASTLPLFIYKIKYQLFKFLQKMIFKKSAKVIVPSEFVKDDILKHYDFPAEKIEVINEGVDVLSPKADFKENVLVDYKISKPFFLYVGAAYPHKNLERMIRAFILFNEDKKFQLVIAGRFDFFMTRLNKWSLNLKNSESVIFTGYVADQKLDYLYRNAKIYIFPSLSEGFGLPGLEAQIRHLPVLASDLDSFKEIFGKGALYFNPYDEEDLEKKLDELTNNNSLVNKLSKFGYENAKKYHWSKMAAETLAVYNNYKK